MANTIAAPASPLLSGSSRPVLGAVGIEAMGIEDAGTGDPGGRSAVLVTADFRYDVSGVPAARLRQMLEGLDGTRTLGDLAARSGIPLGAALALLEPLAEDGFLIDADAPSRARTGAAFVDAFFHECRFWNRVIFGQPFWRGILAGRASREVVLGWGIEFFHFVEAANEYMASGVAHCREGAEIREMTARHYVEEAEHSAIFLQGLAACGLPAERIVEAPPLATTRALINRLNELALQGTLPYAAAFGIMQPTREPGDVNAVNAFYDRLGEFYGYARPMFEGFRTHALIDVDLVHEQTVLERICAGRAAMEEREAAEAFRAARSVAEHFCLFFEGILDGYGGARVQLPRRPARIASFLP
jgi:pyrroloquinoline quinone (PQQ) biosynthesis protein C